MKNIKDELNEDFENENFHITYLRKQYPNVIELFAREQFYRNNQLSIKINKRIEHYCLDLNNLNGENSRTKRLIKAREEKIKIYHDEIGSYIGDESILEWQSNINEIEKYFEDNFLKAWEVDKYFFYLHKRMAFNEIYSSIRNRDISLLRLKENSQKEDEMRTFSEYERKNENLFYCLEEIKFREKRSEKIFEKYWINLKENCYSEIFDNHERIVDLIKKENSDRIKMIEDNNYNEVRRIKENYSNGIKQFKEMHFDGVERFLIDIENLESKLSKSILVNSLLFVIIVLLSALMVKKWKEWNKKILSYSSSS